MSGFIPGRQTGAQIYSLWWPGTNNNVFGRTSNTAGWGFVRNSTGDYVVTHSLGFDNLYDYATWASLSSGIGTPGTYLVDQTTNDVRVRCFDLAGVATDYNVAFCLFPYS